MANKRTYKTNKGVMLDMEALRAANEKTVAAGNMGVNAKGDVIKGGRVVKTTKERVAQHYSTKNVQTARTSIKPPIKKSDNQIQTTKDLEVAKPPAPAPQDLAELAFDPVISVRTRPDGSTYKEIVHSDGNIDMVELTAPTKPKATKKRKTE